MSGQDLAVYAGNFDTQNPTSQQLQTMQGYANDIGTSGLTELVLWALHVNSSGDFIYNGGTPIVSGGTLGSGFSFLPTMLESITSSGNVQTLLFSIGGWTCEGDFLNIGSLFDQYGSGSENPLYANFQALQSQLGITGIDFDLEPDPTDKDYHPYSYYQPIIVELTLMLSSLGLAVTFCPYEEQDFWLDCLASIYSSNNNQQAVSALNLQTYGVGETQKEWVGYINGYTKSPLGIEDPAAFVVPGYSVSGMCPYGTGGIEATFSDPSVMTKGLNGGFMWNYGSILSNQASNTCAPKNTTADYANAMKTGINQLNGS